MSLTPTHLDAVTTAAAELAAAQHQRESADAKLKQTLQSLSAELAEGDIRIVGNAVPAITKVNGVVKYVIVPGLLDPDGASRS
jgi:hypothetical protein